MSTGRSEVNLEISSGFFRISTDKVVYNITVLAGPETGAHKVVQQIVAQEIEDAPVPAAVSEFVPGQIEEGGGDEDFYRKVSTDIFNDIGKLAKSLSSTMGEIPLEDRRLKRVELDEAGEKIEDAKNQLHDIVSMTEKATMEIMDQVEKVQQQTDGVRDLLSMLKGHKAFQAAAESAAEGQREGVAVLEVLREKISRANSLVAELQESVGAPPAAVEAEAVEPPLMVVTRTRYLFAIDVIFQTMYELCTNETVKTHITAARKAAGEIFDTDTFIDSLGERIKDLAPDSDNFFTVPLSDVLHSLLAACSDAKIKNLLKKMDLNQGEIFLDQSLPLEVPPVEEIEETVPVASAGEQEDTGGPPEQAASAPPSGDPRLAELGEVMAETMALGDRLEQAILSANSCEVPPGMSMMSLEDQEDIFRKIEDAFHVTSAITEDVSRITETLSFQDISGQQILKIIKLLSDFQVQLLAIVVSFGSQLKSKEKNAKISAEESKRLAQGDVDKYLKSMTTEQVGGEGALDQSAVNNLLEELGF